MVEAGWDFATLMAMPAGEWGFWFRAHMKLLKDREKQQQRSRKAR